MGFEKIYIIPFGMKYLFNIFKYLKGDIKDYDGNK